MIDFKLAIWVILVREWDGTIDEKAYQDIKKAKGNYLDPT